MPRKAKQTGVRYVLRTCDAEMTSFGGFVWPKSGRVEAPDYLPTYECGHGLHGLLEGRGGGRYLNWDVNAKWLIVEVGAGDGLLCGQGELVDKCKFRGGDVVCCGNRDEALSYLASVQADMCGVVGNIATAGDRGTATAGDDGTATAGHRGTATAGDRGTATAGDGGTAIAGDDGTATAGDEGTATAGYRGTATAGDGGTATAGYRGTATAGDGGTVVICWWDSTRSRLVIGYVGENGIKQDTRYRANTAGELVEGG